MDGCQSFWTPLTIDRGQPKGSVPGELGVVERPDGTSSRPPRLGRPPSWLLINAKDPGRQVARRYTSPGCVRPPGGWSARLSTILASSVAAPSDGRPV